MKYIILVSTGLFLLFNSSFAVKYVSKKEFVKRNIPSGSKLTKSTITLTPQQKKQLGQKWAWKEEIDKATFILGRNNEKAITGAIHFTTIYATEHHCVHHLAIALKPDGSVKEVAVVELFCELAMQVSKQSFLGQFRNKPARMLILNKDISAVTGATASSKRVSETVNSVIALYVELIKKP